MKKILLLFCVLMIAIPAFSENSETVRYMNQSQGFAGFNRSLPQSDTYKKLEKNNKFTSTENNNDEYSNYDSDGWKIEDDHKPSKTEKKVIKSLKNTNGETKTTPTTTPMTYDKFPQNYGNGDTMMMQNFMIPMGGMF